MDPGAKPLSPRFEALVVLLAAGNSNGEVATEQVIAQHTAEKYVSDLKQLVGARDRVELVLWCRERISPQPPLRQPAPAIELGDNLKTGT